MNISALEPEPITRPIEPTPFAGMAADEVLAQQKAEAQSTADRARWLVETSAPDLAYGRYRERTMMVDAVWREIARDPSFSDSDKAQIEVALKAERESIDRVLRDSLTDARTLEAVERHQ